jgi:hypothetical protein
LFSHIGYVDDYATENERLERRGLQELLDRKFPAAA